MEIIRPDDWHVHFRDGNIAKTVVPLHSNIFNRCLVMPNRPVIDSVSKAQSYLNEINDSKFTPLPVRMIYQTTTPEELAGDCLYFTACKLYPTGATTGAEHSGVTNVKTLGPLFDVMAKSDCVLCIHAEDPSSQYLSREYDYLHNVAWITRNFPSLRIVIEHISDKRTIDFVQTQHKNVAGTITVHHLICTIDDSIKNVHYRCNPILKSREDQWALFTALLNNDEGKFFLGTDSAPHLIKVQKDGTINAGIFMPAEIAMSFLIDLFKDNYNTLESFTSIYGARFYQVPTNEEKVTFVNEPWIIPNDCDGLVPFKSGQTANWRLLTEEN